ncbi:hypothetical protein M0D21_13415 [Aquimarina sp. D1M17]|uniref:hypothetical protein n=1 Tax=Aquimarina acroporae TaxID=2937283 RepID=UPI0020C15402|nr:hypothetical protein [Aquimarina acroporae]MCK8522577.1 hypothetical protein [Aquimarina acroporae]
MKKIIPLILVIIIPVIANGQKACLPTKIESKNYTCTLEYNTSNQLVKVSDNNDYVVKLEYNQNGKVAKYEVYDAGELEEWYTVKKGVIEEYDEDGLSRTFRYKYNEQGKLSAIVIRDKDGNELNRKRFTWQKGNIVETIYKGKRGTKKRQYKYDNKPNPLRVLRPIANFVKFKPAAVFSKNNIVERTHTKSKSFSGSYSKTNCPLVFAKNNNQNYLEFTY